MCLGLPGRVVEPIDLACQTMVVDVRGEHVQVSAAMLIGEGIRSPRPGDWVLVHMGLALSQMDEADARDTLESLEELSGMYAEFEIRAGAAETSGPLHPAS